MFENITKFFKKIKKKPNNASNSKETAKERLHLVLMQDRANVSADFLDLMRQEIIDVIKKYIEVDESAIDVRLTNKENDDGTNGAPALYANIPILSIKEEAKKEEGKLAKEKKKKETSKKETAVSTDDKKKEEDINLSIETVNILNKVNSVKKEEKKETVEIEQKEETKQEEPEKVQEEVKVENEVNQQNSEE